MKKKFLPLELIFFVSIILFGFLFVFVLYLSKSSFRAVSARPPVSGSLVFRLDSAEIRRKSVNFSGWVLERGEFIDTYDVRILLYSRKTSSGIEVPCRIKYLPDLTGEISDGTDYGRNGFCADVRFDSFLRNKVTLEGSYDVYLHYCCNGKDLYALCLEGKDAE